MLITSGRLDTVALRVFFLLLRCVMRLVSYRAHGRRLGCPDGPACSRAQNWRASASLWIASVMALVLCSMTAVTAAQVAGIEVRGRVTDEGQAVLPGVTVIIEELKTVVTTGGDGTYVFEGVAPGTYHVRVTLEGYRPERQEITVGEQGLSRDFTLHADLHYSEVVSVSPAPRDPFESFQPTSVLAGQDLALKMEGSLGALLKNEPGVAERSLGSAPARPVIRGMDGDRVLVLQDGVRTGDLSSQSADHGVMVNPLAAERVEVVRGPATLLYGANAIGGLVNVITSEIPMQPMSGVGGAAQLDLASAAGEAGGAADITVGGGRWAMNAGGSGQRSGDIDTPLGDVDNSQSRGGMGHVGLGYTADNGYVGGSYAYDDRQYGVPMVEEGETELTPRQHAFTLRGERRGLSGFIRSLRGSLGVTRYTHDELDAGEVATTFDNDATDLQLLASYRPVGRLSGSFGVSGLVRSFSVVGAEALAPPVDQGGFGLFTYQEITWPHITLQFGARYDRASFSPAELRARDFDNASASGGVLFRPTDATTIAVSFARAARNPALEELYFFGAHPGNFSFEIGNDDLESEVAYGLDVAFRWRLSRFSGEVSYFRNSVDNYIFRNPISEEEFEGRFGELEEEEEHEEGEHEEEDEGEHGHGHEGLQFIEFVGRDALLQGVEAHADLHVTDALVIEGLLDYVRGELRTTNDPLPRMPPLRVSVGAKYHWNALQVGGRLTGLAEQDRIFGEETPTDSATLLDLFGAYSFMTRGVLNTITLSFDNVTDELYRNHLSYIKDLVAERGRNVKVVYSIRF
ncbi:MAG: TonB-dependent receptor [Luteitalea sp.]|nr:TonB-dependent receptor [Luteitalea sp.]